MKTLFVSDIFGRTKALEKLCRDTSAECEIIDPYYGEDPGFENEAQAYDRFMNSKGLNWYSEYLQEQIETSPIQVNLIGFSVGASAIWQISGSLSKKSVKRAACFYGSQIRFNMEIEPSVEVELYLPVSEQTFDIGIIADGLAGKNNVHIHQTKYLHGFMNKMSVNFSHDGYHEYGNLGDALNLLT